MPTADAHRQGEGSTVAERGLADQLAGDRSPSGQY